MAQCGHEGEGKRRKGRGRETQPRKDGFRIGTGGNREADAETKEGRSRNNRNISSQVGRAVLRTENQGTNQDLYKESKIRIRRAR